MKKSIFFLFLVAISFIFFGCGERYKYPQVDVATGVSRSTMGDNIMTRPFYGVYTLLAGHGIDVEDVKVFRNDTGFLEVQITAHNRAVYDKRFDYRMDWLDAKGVIVESKANVWTTVSAKSRTVVRFTAVAPTKDVTDFKMITRETPK